MQLWRSLSAAAIALSGCLSAACGDDDGAVDGAADAGSAGVLPDVPPRPPATPVVADFVSACFSGLPELPTPMFEPPPAPMEDATDTDGGSSGASGDAAASEDTSDAGSGSASTDDEGGSTTGDLGTGSSDAAAAGASSSGDSPLPFTGAVAWPLRETGHLVGVALAAHRLRTPEYAHVAATQFNYVTPENEMKWDVIERTPGTFNFRDADTIVEFARNNHMKVKGHTLVWHSQVPEWVEELQGPEAVRAAMERHIRETMVHFMDEYPGMVVAWDVVNEAIDSQNGVAGFRDSVFYRELGEGFIAEAFTLARSIDPDVILLYNDYGIEGLGAKSNATYEMVRRLVENNVPIDGVGFQMHTTGHDFGPQRLEFEQNLQRYIDLGLRVNISEMDVTLCFGYGDREQAWAAQRERVRQMVGTCTQFAACESVTFWGVADRDSWLRTQRPCDDTNFEPWPLLFDDDYQPKPAWYGAYDAFTGCLAWR